MSKNVYKKNRGFSLIETLLAITILMIAITGPLALVQSGLFSANHERNQITATYLAQEAIEYVRSVRDANSYKQYSISPTSWLVGPGTDQQTLLDLCGLTNIAGGSGCLVDPHGGFIDINPVNPYFKTLTPSNNINLPIFEKQIAGDGANKILVSYGYQTSGSGFTFTPTSFTRKVVISQISPEEVNVTATVGWMDNALPRSYTVSEDLMNYQIPDAPSGPALVLSSGGGVNGLPLTVDQQPTRTTYTLNGPLDCSSLSIGNGVTLDLNGYGYSAGCLPTISGDGKIIDTTDVSTNNGANNLNSSCTPGTNNIPDGGQCNGINLAGNSCETLGLSGTGLRCDSTCHYDTSQCAGPIGPTDIPPLVAASVDLTNNPANWTPSHIDYAPIGPLDNPDEEKSYGLSFGSDGEYDFKNNQTQFDTNQTGGVCNIAGGCLNITSFLRVSYSASNNNGYVPVTFMDSIAGAGASYVAHFNQGCSADNGWDPTNGCPNPYNYFGVGGNSLGAVNICDVPNPSWVPGGWSNRDGTVKSRTISTDHKTLNITIPIYVSQPDVNYGTKSDYYGNQPTFPYNKSGTIHLAFASPISYQHIDANNDNPDFCGNNTPPPTPYCGDGIKNGSEQCDDSDLGTGASCSALVGSGYTGTVSCNPGTCTYNTSQCSAPPPPSGYYCDGNNNHGEQCNGDTNGLLCSDFYDNSSGSNFTGGTLNCSSCNYDTSQCTSNGSNNGQTTVPDVTGFNANAVSGGGYDGGGGEQMNYSIWAYNYDTDGTKVFSANSADASFSASGSFEGDLSWDDMSVAGYVIQIQDGNGNYFWGDVGNVTSYVDYSQDDLLQNGWRQAQFTPAVTSPYESGSARTTTNNVGGFGGEWLWAPDGGGYSGGMYGEQMTYSIWAYNYALDNTQVVSTNPATASLTGFWSFNVSLNWYDAGVAGYIIQLEDGDGNYFWGNVGNVTSFNDNSVSPYDLVNQHGWHEGQFVPQATSPYQP